MSILTPCTLRVAVPEDAAELVEIYAPYVLNTAITFEYTVPTEAEFKERIENTLTRYPYFVARDAKGRAAGYAYASPFKEREAYDHVAELSIYVRKEVRQQGLGRFLYSALEESLTLMGIVSTEACIACPALPDDPFLDDSSLRFHERLGYMKVAHFKCCGYKFERWYDMVWMEKQLQARKVPAPAIRPFYEVAGEILRLKTLP